MQTGYLDFEIKVDSGEGLKKEELNREFELFLRNRNSQMDTHVTQESHALSSIKQPPITNKNLLSEFNQGSFSRVEED